VIVWPVKPHHQVDTSAAKAFARGPTLTPAAPVADETCWGWRNRPRF